jgi:hypothetical protein
MEHHVNERLTATASASPAASAAVMVSACAGSMGASWVLIFERLTIAAFDAKWGH